MIHPKQAFFMDTQQIIYGTLTIHLLSISYPSCRFFAGRRSTPQTRLSIAPAGCSTPQPRLSIAPAGCSTPQTRLSMGGRKVFHPLTPGPPGARPGDAQDGTPQIATDGRQCHRNPHRIAENGYSRLVGHGKSFVGLLVGSAGTFCAPGVRRGWTGTVGGVMPRGRAHDFGGTVEVAAGSGGTKEPQNSRLAGYLDLSGRHRLLTYFSPSRWKTCWSA